MANEVRVQVTAKDDASHVFSAVSRNAKAMGTQVGGATGALGGFTRALGSVAPAGAALAALIAVTVGAVTKFGQVTVGAAAQFETSFAGIRKTMNLTEGQFKELEKANRDLAKSIPVTVNELNRIGELGGQLGIARKNIVEFETTIAALTRTTNLSAESAALSFAQIANVIQLPQDQIDNLGSAVVGLGNNFATVESSIVDFTQRIAGAAAIAKIAPGAIVGIGTAFASIGVEAEAGGSAIQKVLLDMVQAVNKPGKELDKLARVAGVTSKEFADLFQKDAARAFVKFVEGLGQQGDNAAAVLDDMGLSDVRLMRAFLGAAGAGDLLRRAVEKGNVEFAKNTALTDEARKRYATFDSQVQLLKNKFYDLAVTFGNILMPKVLEGLNGISRWLATNETKLVGAFDAGVQAVGRLQSAINTLRNSPPVQIYVDVIKRETTIAGGAAQAVGRVATSIAGAVQGAAQTGKAAVAGTSGLFNLPKNVGGLIDDIRRVGGGQLPGPNGFLQPAGLLPKPPPTKSARTGDTDSGIGGTAVNEVLDALHNPKPAPLPEIPPIPTDSGGSKSDPLGDAIKAIQDRFNRDLAQAFATGGDPAFNELKAQQDQLRAEIGRTADDLMTRLGVDLPTALGLAADAVTSAADAIKAAGDATQQRFNSDLAKAFLDPKKGGVDAYNKELAKQGPLFAQIAHAAQQLMKVMGVQFPEAYSLATDVILTGVDKLKNTVQNDLQGFLGKLGARRSAIGLNAIEGFKVRSAPSGGGSQGITINRSIGVMNIASGVSQQDVVQAVEAADAPLLRQVRQTFAETR